MSFGPYDAPHLLVYEPEQAELAVESLLQQHQSKRRVLAFIRSVALGVQCLEDQAFEIIVASLIGPGTPFDLLTRWAGLIGESRGALTKGELLRVLCTRVGANTIGSTENKASIPRFLALVAEAFSDDEVIADYYPEGAPITRIRVLASPLLTDALAARAATAVALAVPIGTLVTIREAPASDGLRFDTPGRGFDGSKLGATLYNGFTSRRS